MTSSSSNGVKIGDDKAFTEGDCTIISSDNIRFKIPSYYLLSSSEVIRDMYKANPTGSKPFEIEMSDTDLENGEAIRLWLEATQWKFPAVNGCLLDKALQIINLARKYDCAPMRAAMMRLVYEAIAKKSIAIDKLVIFGAIVDEPELVAEVMRKQGIDQTTVFKSASKVTVKHIAPQKKRKLDDSSDVDLLENIKHISTPSEIPANYPKLYSSLDKKVSIATPQGGTDPTSWCMDDWRRVPYDYLWALSQVSLREFTTSNRAQRFLDIMRIIRTPVGGETKSKKITRGCGKVSSAKP